MKQNRAFQFHLNFSKLNFRYDKLLTTNHIVMNVYVYSHQYSKVTFRVASLTFCVLLHKQLVSMNPEPKKKYSNYTNIFRPHSVRINSSKSILSNATLIPVTFFSISTQYIMELIFQPTCTIDPSLFCMQFTTRL